MNDAIAGSHQPVSSTNETAIALLTCSTPFTVLDRRRPAAAGAHPTDSRRTLDGEAAQVRRQQVQQQFIEVVLAGRVG